MNIPDVIIRLVLHLIVLASLWLIISPLLDKTLKKDLKQVDNRLQIKFRLMGQKADNLRRRGKFYRHLDQLLFFTNPRYEQNNTTIRFIIKSVFIFTIVLVGSLLTLGGLPELLSTNNPFLLETTRLPQTTTVPWKLAALLGLICSAMPYFVVFIRYMRRNIQSSYDLLEVVHTMTKYTNLSTDAMLDRTSELLSTSNVLKRPLKHLGNIFASYSNEKELQEEVSRFSRLIGTTFSTQLAHDLLYAEREGNSNLNKSLFYLAKAMEEQSVIIYQVKAKSQEAVQFGFYINIIVFIICIASVIFYVSPYIYMKLQFGTSVGLFMISSIIITFVISFCFSVYLSKPKLDYN